MTPFKNFSTQGSWKKSIRRGGLYVAVAAVLSTQVGCGGSDNGSDWETVTVQEPVKGVITTVEETTAGEFTIVDEKVVDRKEDSRMIVRKLDGKIDTLNLDQARSMVSAADTVSPHSNGTHYRSHGMGNMIWWGAMGYMMGRNMNSGINPGIYRNPSAGYAAGSELQRTSVSRTVSRPVSGRSGFFGRSSRGSSGG